MRIHNVLDKILNQEVKIRILRFFCLNEQVLSGRQLAKELKINLVTCHKALQELQNEGVLNLIIGGRSHLYSLNSDNYVVKKILNPLYGKED
ncbi:winged helix-turn-helix domain-containing protein, partial [bacterium]|nr:winged helix-turn-helix domain-containing protein [bacterium]